MTEEVLMAEFLLTSLLTLKKLGVQQKERRVIKQCELMFFEFEEKQ